MSQPISTFLQLVRSAGRGATWWLKYNLDLKTDLQLFKSVVNTLIAVFVLVTLLDG